MDPRSMFGALGAFWLASLLLSPALGQDPGGDPGACEARCERGAKEVFFQAKRLGATDEQAQARASAFYESCLKGCVPVEPPADPPPSDPPPVPSCRERCGTAAAELKAQLKARGLADEEIARRVQEFLRSCQAGCGEVPPPQPPSCEEKCRAQYDAALARCVANCPEEDAECAARCRSAAELVVAACKLRCAGDPDPCATACAAEAAKAFESCLAEPGADPRACRLRANERLEACLAEKCRPPRPEPPACADRCAAEYRAWLERCRDDEACAAAAEAFLAKCRERCAAVVQPPPPEEPPCISPCERMRSAIEAMCGKLVDAPEKCAALVAEFEALCASELGEVCAAEARVKAGGFARFLRGDVARNRRVDIADAVALLMGLFQGDPRILECEDASDANDDGALDIGDAVTILGHLFGDGRPLPPPSDLGLDGSADGLGCAREDLAY